MFSRLCVLFLVGMVGIAAACGILSEASSPAEIARLGCYGKAFEPLAGSYERAQMLVEQISSGEVNIEAAISAFDATEDELADLYAALQDCRIVGESTLGGAGAGGSDASDAGVR
jgi:hypothetical protein